MNLLGGKRNRVGGALSGDGLAALSRELERARRYERPFVLVRVPLERPPAGGSQPSPCGHVASSIRKVDRCWLSDGSVYVLLPESTRRAAEGLLDRIGEGLRELRLDAAQIACFPEDGVTAGALLDAVRRQDAPFVHRGRSERRPKQMTPASELRPVRDASSGG